MYKAIFKSSEVVDAAPLYEEFRGWPNAKLNPVYQGNLDWTGICVYGRNGPNYLKELPALHALITRVGLEYVTGVTYFNLAPNSTPGPRPDPPSSWLDRTPSGLPIRHAGTAGRLGVLS